MNMTSNSPDRLRRLPFSTSRPTASLVSHNSVGRHRAFGVSKRRRMRVLNVVLKATRSVGRQISIYF